MYYVYLLQSEKDKRFYVGFTSDLKRRIFEHNTAKVQSTKAFIPYRLIYFEGFRSKKDALNREKC
jgi:putative endonuclease